MELGGHWLAGGKVTGKSVAPPRHHPSRGDPELWQLWLFLVLYSWLVLPDALLALVDRNDGRRAGRCAGRAGDVQGGDVSAARRPAA